MEKKFWAINNFCHIDCYLAAESESYRPRWRLLQTRFAILSGREKLCVVLM
jgi:hypothetical protein